MATARLVPSTYYLSNTQYLSVSNAANMYTNIDSTTHGTITHNRASTNSTYYAYLRGFDFSDIPAAAVVSSFTVKIRASATGHTTSTSSSYRMSLANGTTQIGSTTVSNSLSTTLTTFTIPIGSLTWDQVVDYGSDFGIRIPLRRASSNTADVVSVYGAEIEVTYTVPSPRTITTTLSGSGTISPSGTTTAYDGDEFELTITPTDKSATVTATDGGVDVTPELVGHYSGSGAASAVLGTYSLVSGGFNGSGASYFQSLVGAGVDHTQTTSNYYSSGSGTNAVFQYAISLNIPSGVTITRLYMEANGHAESTSNSSEYMCVQLKSGSTELSEQYNFKSHGTSNGTVTVEATTIPTAAQLSDLVVECTLGYYGGAINGVTVYVEYETPSSHYDYYTYTITVSGDTTIAVVIGGSVTPPVITVGTPSRTRISAVTSYDQCVCTFTSDLALSQWEARATKAGVTPARGVGLLVESGGALAANTPATVYVENEELTQGDGEYTITVYGLSTGGIWSE